MSLNIDLVVVIVVVTVVDADAVEQMNKFKTREKIWRICFH